MVTEKNALQWHVTLSTQLLLDVKCPPQEPQWLGLN